MECSKKVYEYLGKTWNKHCSEGDNAVLLVLSGSRENRNLEVLKASKEVGKVNMKIKMYGHPTAPNSSLICSSRRLKQKLFLPYRASLTFPIHSRHK